MKLLLISALLLFGTNAGALSFETDVLPIFNIRCNNCHNSRWPEKNWKSYNTVLRNLKPIKKVMMDKTMPPGNMTRMTEKERIIVYTWIKQGGPK